jgi:hypothetical protein
MSISENVQISKKIKSKYEKEFKFRKFRIWTDFEILFSENNFFKSDTEKEKVLTENKRTYP